MVSSFGFRTFYVLLGCAAAIAMILSFAKKGNHSTTSSGWIVGDFHEHSHFSDGGMRLDSVFAYSAANFGTNFMLNTDHGGAYPRNPDGTNWSKLPDIKFEGDSAGFDKNGEPQMWRWQELRDYSYPVVAAFRKRFPNRHFIQGLEWNSPATSHTTVGILADDGIPIASFEYQFDQADKDVSGGPAAGLVKMNGRKNGNGEALPKEEKTKATSAAVQWLDKNHKNKAWVLMAHPERGGNVSVADLRNVNNAAPDVAFGFEGIPGHQKHTLRAIFYPDVALGGGTYGGVGYMAAKVGGVWDALLGEGRHFWLFTSSDFHGTTSDFWPGEYHKSWIYSKDTTSSQAILNGMRSGNVFVTNGDIINKLQFQLLSGKKQATMGETFNAVKGKKITVSIRFKTPEKNFNGQSNKVKMVQLIGGNVTGKIDPSSPDFNKDSNESARIVKLFTEKDWKENNGWTEIKFGIDATADMYFRIRGSNHLPGTSYETDNAGSPLADTLAHHLNIDGPQEAWADLWFYSNPIFLTVK